MRGSIRAGVGFLLAFGAVGGIENGSNLAECLVIAVVGLGLMFSGINAMNRRPS